MRKKKVLGMMLSFTLAFGLALPASMAMPIESTVISSDSNATEEEKRVIISEIENEESVAVATDSNAAKTGNSVLATDSNAAKTGNSVLATDSNATKVTSEHIETCLEGCTGEDCECVCHLPSLFERLMATETLEEFYAIIEMTDESEFSTLTDEEHWEIEAHMIALEPELVPEVTLLEGNEETVLSEIVSPMVSFTNVAPIVSSDFEEDD